MAIYCIITLIWPVQSRQSRLPGIDGGRTGERLFMGKNFFQSDGNVLELDSGDGLTIQ